MIPFEWKSWWVLSMLIIILFCALARKMYDMRLKQLRRANYYDNPSPEPTSPPPNNSFVLRALPPNDIPVQNPIHNAGAGEELPVERPNESVTVSRESAKEGCSICLDEFGDDVAVLRCDHLFHLRCIVAWTANNKWCPLCRRAVDWVIMAKLELGFRDIEAQ